MPVPSQPGLHGDARAAAGSLKATILKHQACQDACSGLVIFTFGSRPVLYGRRGEEIAEARPYEVQVVDALGAGDTFRAGVVYDCQRR